jgi:acetylornithine deacetylase/succinyl-diaminopimelate desuccinylase-like protein
LTSKTTTWQAFLDDREATHDEEFFELVRIPTVSTDPAHAADMRRGAAWVAARLTAAGVPHVELLESPGHPVVYGTWHGVEGGRTVLVYGHYDVQPADPLELWETPAFEPTVRDGRVYARGAADMKANLVTVIQAVEALAAQHGQPPLNLTFFFEGEEEIGSAHTPGVVREHRDKLGADVVLSCDGGMEGPDRAALLVGLKGITGCQLDLSVGSSDMHSGQYGAAVPNALRAMAELAASFHTADGRVAVDGFYDEVVDLTPAEREEIALVNQSDEELKEEAGVYALWGEAGYTPVERQFARPTLDFNGMWGGWQGEGVKTVTPCEAHLKITCRLVPDQDPARIVDLIRAHVAAHTPAGSEGPGRAERVGCAGLRGPADNPFLLTAERVMADVYGSRPLVVRSGGSVPITEVFRSILGLDTVTIGFGCRGARSTRPNEWFRMEDLAKARRRTRATSRRRRARVGRPGRRGVARTEIL